MLDAFARAVGQRQGLLCLIATVEIQDYGPHPAILGPRVTDHGPLVLALQIHWGVVLFGNAISIHAPITS